MLKTPQELLGELGEAIRSRRIGQGLSQLEAAGRAGVGLRTWRRLEISGQATIETLVNAAIVLRCEEGVSQLFPPLAASSLDDLLARQAATTRTKPRLRVSRRARSQ
ncbi:MAG: DNA-binding protein [Alphaproteobacteria bacterium PA2]|nr:MAG: DNA-binding protein [Alphaproteobacteria bacterium PA2]